MSLCSAWKGSVSFVHHIVNQLRSPQPPSKKSSSCTMRCEDTVCNVTGCSHSGAAQDFKSCLMLHCHWVKHFPILQSIALLQNIRNCLPIDTMQHHRRHKSLLDLLLLSFPTSSRGLTSCCQPNEFSSCQH